DPSAEYPYGNRIAENEQRTKSGPEYGPSDTGIFAERRYFYVVIEYAKAAPGDILIRISTVNRGSEEATLHLLPTLWYRNTWAWGYDGRKPTLKAEPDGKEAGYFTVTAQHFSLGQYQLYAECADEGFFTENETNCVRLYGSPNAEGYVKDAFHDYVVNNKQEAVNPAKTGTKAAAHYTLKIAPGATATIRLRLSKLEAEANAEIMPFE